MAKNRQAQRQSGRKRPGRNRRRGRPQQVIMPFERRNYVLLLLGLAIVILGYVVMRVENKIDGFWSLYVCPLLLLFGYLEIIYAIVWRPRTEATEE